MTPEQRFRRNWRRVEARHAAERRAIRVLGWTLAFLVFGAYFFGSVMGLVYRGRL